MSRVAAVDAAFVAEKRAQRAGWGAIAAMTGVSEIDLRRRFVAGFVDPTPRPEASPRAVMERALGARGLVPDHARIVARLWQANGAVVSTETLIRGIGGAALGGFILREALKAGEVRLGLGFRRANGTGGAAMAGDSVALLNALVEARG